ncbi:MAG: chromosome segregation protein SMC [bacterium]
MYFKKLELLGFKSFADKTQLRFESGITAIVGPNGCGKTNISEAIMWVLGEQSARQLRGMKMGDVIFNGSGSRQGVSMAEVSLTLDNSQNVIPVDYSEVTVTRRMFRSGDTEYLINKTPCRLKDITELFMDTGIGTDAYSIIEESKIDLILSSKSEDRRFLFEEAAGIMKYKIRKNEALGKLDKTEQNLARLADILQEIKSRISSLDYQVRKARQYQKHKDSSKAIEIDLLLHELRALTMSIEGTSEEFSSVRGEIEGLEAGINTHEADISALKLRLAELDEKMLTIQQDFSRVTGELQRKEERITNIQEKKETLNAQKIKLQEQVLSDEDKIRDLKETSGNVQSDLENIENVINTHEALLKKKGSILNQEGEILSRLTAELETSKQAVFSLLHDISKCRNDITTLTMTDRNICVQQEKLSREKRALQHEKKNLCGKSEAIVNSIASKETELSGARDQKERLGSDINTIQASLSELTGEYERKTQELNRTSSRCDFLEKMQVSFEGYDEAVKEVLSRNIPQVYGSLASVIDAGAEYEKAVENVLGRKLQYIITENVSSARKASMSLGEEQKGRVTFLLRGSFSSQKGEDTFSFDESKIITRAINAVKFDESYRNIVQYLLSDTVIVDNFDNALEVAGTSKGRGVVVTLTGEVIECSSGSVVMVHGGGRSCEGSFLATKREVRELKDALPGISEAIEVLRKDKEKLEAALKEKRAQLEELNLRLQKIEVMLGGLRSEKEVLQREEEKIIKQQETFHLEEGQWAKELTQVRENLEAVNISLGQLQEAKSHNEGNINALETQVQDKNRVHLGIREEITGIKVDLAQNIQKRENLNSEVGRLKETIEVLEKSLEEKKAEILSIDAGIEELGNSSSLENSQIESLLDERDSIDKVLQDIRSQRQRITSSVDEKDEFIKTKRKDIEGRKAHFHQKELRNAQINTHREEVSKRLIEDFAIADGDKRSENLSNIDIEDQKLELAKLKRKVESMGAVNLVAIDEYQELEERYKFLLKQQEDLIKAKEDLHKVIEKTNLTARSHFKETFEKVRNNFITICQKLFEGGEADLVLTNPDQLLDTGIEIIVQPPGKKLQSISLLSAGERALTAIALLFSIFMVKPSPFCLLDEIDAPLDEANLQRFVRMLREFSSNSQFIVITHNKRTMEMADVLYGVTMEEFGVSKLVSVRLKEEENIEATI